MSDEQGQPQGAGEPPPGAGEERLSPEQQEMLRQMEEEMRRVSVQDLLAQSVVSILNLSYRRIAKEDERDLEQARVGIDAIRALADLLEPEAQREVRNALTQVQMAYAQIARETPGAQATASQSPGGTEAGAEPGSGGAGGAGKPPPRLWTPGSG